jgi:hypothetical protein
VGEQGGVIVDAVAGPGAVDVEQAGDVAAVDQDLGLVEVAVVGDDRTAAGVGPERFGQGVGEGAQAPGLIGDDGGEQADVVGDAVEGRRGAGALGQFGGQAIEQGGHRCERGHRRGAAPGRAEEDVAQGAPGSRLQHHDPVVGPAEAVGHGHAADQDAVALVQALGLPWRHDLGEQAGARGRDLDDGPTAGAVRPHPGADGGGVREVPQQADVDQQPGQARGVHRRRHAHQDGIVGRSPDGGANAVVALEQSHPRPRRHPAPDMGHHALAGG